MFVYFILGTLISAIGFFSDMTVSREKVRDAGNSGGALGSKCASLTYSFAYFLVYLLAYPMLIHMIEYVHVITSNDRNSMDQKSTRTAKIYSRETTTLLGSTKPNFSSCKVTVYVNF